MMIPRCSFHLRVFGGPQGLSHASRARYRRKRGRKRKSFRISNGETQPIDMWKLFVLIT